MNFGGAEDVVESVFGRRLPICDPGAGAGWTARAREAYIYARSFAVAFYDSKE